MAKGLMIQGTASNAGKSILTAALCRIFKQDGYRVAPFKSQNMALNSYVTADGLELGRAQAVQAEAAGLPPDVRMNPVLLKPTGDTGSQVIIMGKPVGNLTAREYYATKKDIIPKVREVYESLSADNDIIVIEGAGSPAEINLREDDFVNMGMAKIARAPVLLVGDIDKGGVFASLYGTCAIIEPDERDIIRGLIINKFRGDVEILRPGLKMLEDLCKKPVVGIVPFARFDIEDEDSVSARVETHDKSGGEIDIAVIRLPRISNFTDFNPLERIENVAVRYVRHVRELGNPDMIIIPGSKNTMDDLFWLRTGGIEDAIKQYAADGKPVFGVCGGYQMMGRSISDPFGTEHGGEMEGMGLLPVDTVFREEKTTVQVAGRFGKIDGMFAPLSGIEFQGYEIHMGESEAAGGASLTRVTRGGSETADGAWRDNCAGTYVHGIFDSGRAASAFASILAKRRGLEPVAEAVDSAAYKEQQYDLLADVVRGALDMDMVYEIVEKGLEG
ncbi:MAG: cobyric acid synthase [Oscillospiraceae bacterium]|jgi:adenosylcobyric acid synthase|nr:cobyric acid synthase [Oscillospiraceae bacterium]